MLGIEILLILKRGHVKCRFFGYYLPIISFNIFRIYMYM